MDSTDITAKYISIMAASSTPLHARSQPRDGIGRDSTELEGVIERTDSSASSSSSWDLLPQVWLIFLQLKYQLDENIKFKSICCNQFNFLC